MKIDTERMQKIALLESITGAGAKDCLIDEEKGRVIFVINEGEMGLAIGRNGKNIKKVEKKLGKSIELVEYSEDPATFIKNSLKPAEIQSVTLKKVASNGEKEKEKVAEVELKEEERGIAIGKDGKNIEKAKTLGERHHKIKDIQLI